MEILRTISRGLVFLMAIVGAISLFPSCFVAVAFMYLSGMYDVLFFTVTVTLILTSLVSYALGKYL